MESIYSPTRYILLILLLVAITAGQDIDQPESFSLIYYGDSEVNIGDEFSITCIISVSDPIQWLKDGETLTKHNLRHGRDDHAYITSEHGIEGEDDKIEAKLTVKHALLSHEGKYQCNSLHSNNFFYLKVHKIDKYTTPSQRDRDHDRDRDRERDRNRDKEHGHSKSRDPDHRRVDVWEQDRDRTRERKRDRDEEYPEYNRDRDQNVKDNIDRNHQSRIRVWEERIQNPRENDGIHYSSRGTISSRNATERKLTRIDFDDEYVPIRQDRNFSNRENFDITPPGIVLDDNDNVRDDRTRKIINYYDRGTTIDDEDEGMLTTRFQSSPSPPDMEYGYPNIIRKHSFRENRTMTTPTNIDEYDTRFRDFEKYRKDFTTTIPSTLRTHRKSHSSSRNIDTIDEDRQSFTSHVDYQSTLKTTSTATTERLLLTTHKPKKPDALVPNYDNANHRLKVFVIRYPLTLSCNITLEGTGHTLVWEKNGTEVSKIDDLKGRYTVLDDERTFFIKKTLVTDTGNYSCAIKDTNHKKEFNVIAQVAIRLQSNTGVVENEKMTIHCLVLGTNPIIEWTIANKTIDETTDRYILKEDENKIKNAILMVEKIVLEDRGDVICTAWNMATEANYTKVSATTLVRVKGKLAALWPFLGICAEVFVLCAIILIYEKRRSKTELEESDTDPNTEQKNDLPGKDTEVRQRK